MNRGTDGSEVVPRFFVKLGTAKTSVVNLEIDPIILDPGVYFNYFFVISEQ